MATELKNTNVAILMTDGVEQAEYAEPRQFLEQQGVKVTLISTKDKGDQIQAFNHMQPSTRYIVELNVRDAKPADYDALVLPGGVANPDQLRLHKEAITFIREFGREDKPIAAICHGPWTLIDADLVKGKHVTSWPSLEVDLRNAGAEWSDEEVVVDGKLITSRKPDDIPAFNHALQQQLQAALAA